MLSWCIGGAATVVRFPAEDGKVDELARFSALGGGLRHTRSESRDSMFLAATLHRAKGEIRLRVRNLSAGGLMGETSDSFETGEAVELELRGIGRIAAHIAWTAPQRIGVAFDQPIDPRLARKPVGTKESNIGLAKPVTTGLRRSGLKLDRD